LCEQKFRADAARGRIQAGRMTAACAERHIGLAVLNDAGSVPE